jgi:hypothetical protein
LVAAQQKSNESKDGQKDDWHGSRLFISIPLQVNPLQPDRKSAMLHKHKFIYTISSNSESSSIAV